MNRAARRAGAAGKRRETRRQVRAGQVSRCPKCHSTDILRLPDELAPAMRFYGRDLEGCRRCKAIWEAVPRDLVWDPSDPFCSFSEPCGNCAFRPGSPEQRDREEWRKTIADLKAGGRFYCHKGVPIDPKAEHGFLYPTLSDGGPDPKRMRLCRGFLNAWGAWVDKAMEETP